MRTRVLLTSLLLALVSGLSTGGCQVLAGLTVIEITGSTGTGGQGSTGSSSCVPCANGEACNDSSDCQSGYCAKSDEAKPGVCAATKKPGIECTKGEECGLGYCTDGVCCNVAHCADECQTCSASGTGVCGPTKGATCGASCGDGLVQGGTCGADGKCGPLTPTKMCESSGGCNPATLTCNSTCTSSSDCSSEGFCAMGVGHCAPCNVSPPDPTKCTVGQNGCDSCDAAANNTCVTSCTAAGECGGSKTKTLTPMMGPARLECNGQCNGLKVLCQGPFPCEVVCDSGACNGLTLMCGPDGPCKITCKGTGCVGATGATINCGDNGCEATCEDGAANLTQKCNGSCGCTKTGCP
ncbi:MAG: hypothetical protein ABJE95_17390 [Byssovorax sp.]